MATTIKCTNCNTQIEITEALKRQLEGQILQQVERKHKLELRSKEDELKQKIIAVKKLERQRALETAKQDFSAAIEDAKEQSKEQLLKNQKLQEHLADIMKLLRVAKDAETNLKVE